MTSYPDLSPYEYDHHDTVPSYNVGWLEVGMPFPTGPTRVDFHHKLAEHCQGQFFVNLYKGAHSCQFCELSGNSEATTGNGEIRVIGRDIIYAAPALIAHYVIEHDYKPPDEFVEAVTVGPGPDSAEHRILRSMIRGEFRKPTLPPEVKERLQNHRDDTEKILTEAELTQLVEAGKAGQPLSLAELSQVLRMFGPQLDPATVSQLVMSVPIKHRRAARIVERAFDESEFGGILLSLDEWVQIFQDGHNRRFPFTQTEEEISSHKEQMIDLLKAGEWIRMAPLPYLLKVYAEYNS